MQTAMKWYESLEERFAALSGKEKESWLETEDGKSYTAIMNASWREDWEEIVKAEWLRRFVGRENAPGGESRERFNALENEDLPNGAYLVRVTYTGNETRRETVRLPIHRQKTRRKVDADRS